ncbi:hypothetical protein BJV74DRAFT_881176 [Russula compacta]|nr:hypothetical protein BJV74DRAFT_881176 [Russula compacta]
MLFRTKENAQRKYVDMIKEVCTMWPNWDPSKNIHAGDFGTVSKSSGVFTPEGNIYTHSDIAHIANQYRPIQSPDIDHYQLHTYEVRGLDIENDAIRASSDPGVVFKSRWRFNDKRGAILLMHRPQMTIVPDEFFKVSVQIPILKGKCLVYQTWNCPGFFMYLSNRSSEQMTVSLHKSVPAPAGSGTNTTPPVTFNWSAEGSAGVRQYAYKPGAVYTPLLRMRSIRRPLLRRDEKGPGEEGWYETDVPWPDIDEEGATEPEDVYDDGFEDDDD